jgi:hypothetical protein
MTAVVVGLAVAVVLLAVLVAGLLRGHAEVLRALHQMGVELDPAKSDGHTVAVAAPTSRPGAIRPTPGRPLATDVIDIAGTTPGGDPVSVAVAEVRHDTLLAFLTTGCATCRGFWNAFADPSMEIPGGARLVVVTRGPEGESPGAVAALAAGVPVVMSTVAWEHYDIPYAPYFVYVSGPAGRVVGEGVAAGWEEVKVLVANAVADGTTSPVRRGAHERSAADQRRDSEVDHASIHSTATAADLPSEVR